MGTLPLHLTSRLPPPTPHPRRFRYPPNNAKVLMRLVDLLVVHTQRGPFAIWQCMVSF